MQPLVSVIIPVYNHAAYVIQAIQSVLDQTYKNFEMIVIDDGSKDSSVELIEKFISFLNPAAQKKILFIKQGNEGAHNTINKGLSLAKGDYLTILNSDDYYHPERLEKLIGALKNKRGLCFTRVFAVDGGGKAFNPHDPWHRWYEKSLLEMKDYPGLGFILFKSNIAVSSGNLFFSRSLYEKVGEFKDLKLAHDLDFFLRCVLYEEPLFVDEALYFYRFHGSNTTHSVKHLLQEEMQKIYLDYLALAAKKQPENHLAPCKWYWPAEFWQLREKMQINDFFLKDLKKSDLNHHLNLWHQKKSRLGKVCRFLVDFVTMGICSPYQTYLYGIHEWPTWLVCASLPFKRVHWHLSEEIHPNAILPGGMGRWIWKKVHRKKKLTFTFETTEVLKAWKTLGIEGLVLPRYQKKLSQARHFGYRLYKGRISEAEELIEAFLSMKEQGMIHSDTILEVAGFSDKIDSNQADLMLKVRNSSYEQHIYFRKDLDYSKIDLLIKSVKDFNVL